MYRGYLQVTESYSSSGSFVLQLILCDKSVDVFTSSRRCKNLFFCHLTFSFDLRPCHLHRLFDRCHHLDHRPLVFCFGRLGLNKSFCPGRKVLGSFDCYAYSPISVWLPLVECQFSRYRTTNSSLLLEDKLISKSRKLYSHYLTPFSTRTQRWLLALQSA